MSISTVKKTIPYHIINFISFSIPILLVIFFLPQTGHSQVRGNAPIKLTGGIAGSIGMGFSEITVKTPKNDIRFDQGVYAALQGEVGVGSGIFFTTSVSYLQSAGRLNYRYSSLSETFLVNDIGFENVSFQTGLGLKKKFFSSMKFRPYIELGGVIGQHEIRYTDKIQELQNQGSGFKRRDAFLEMGYYGEGGLELQFVERFGVRVSFRHLFMRTRAFDTLDGQKIDFEAQIIQVGVLSTF